MTSKIVAWNRIKKISRLRPLRRREGNKWQYKPTEEGGKRTKK